MGEFSKDSLTPGGARAVLSDALPLDTPYLIQMFPSGACNFRCGFCIYALERSQRGQLSDCMFMDMGLYRKCIDDMRAFPQKLKMLRFAAIGEPLLHKNIAEMVAYAKQAQIAESIDIVTNGSLLTHALSDALIDAGLDRLRISVEGLSGKDYRKNAQAEVDFPRLVEQIGYFYTHSKTTHVYIKIIDYMVQTPERQRRFFELFQPVSHSIAIEHLTPTIPEIDYGRLSGGQANDLPQNGGKLLQAEVCPQGFYMMQINPDGKVVPCCSMKYPAVLGDVHYASVPELGNGSAVQHFRLEMLRSRAAASPVCRDCSLYRYDLHEEDVLDAQKERIAEAILHSMGKDADR